MDVFEALRQRHSVRVFRSDPVPADLAKEITEAALRAPSWANTQPWEVFAVAGEPLERIRSGYLARYATDTPPSPDLPGVKTWPAALRQRTAELVQARAALQGLDLSKPEDNKKFGEANARLFGAPLIVWLCLDRALTPSECGSGFPLYDIGAFSLAVMLAAEAKGLGSIPAFSLVLHPDLIRAEVGIPDSLAVAMGIALGYEDTEAPLNTFRSERRSLDEAVRFVGL